jgi:hypothetical protein
MPLPRAYGGQPLTIDLSGASSEEIAEVQRWQWSGRGGNPPGRTPRGQTQGEVEPSEERVTLGEVTADSHIQPGGET